MSARRTEDVKRKPTGVRQTEIVDAATRILGTRGERRFTAQLLAAEVGVTAGAIYRHFGSMEEIVQAVIERMETILFADFPPPEKDPLRRLEAFFHQRVRVIAAHPDLSRLLLSDTLAHVAGAAAGSQVADFKRRSQGFVAGCIAEAVACGILPPRPGSEAGAVLVVGSILALAHAGPRLTGGGKLAELAGEVWTAIAGALSCGNAATNQGPLEQGAKEQNAAGAGFNTIGEGAR